MTEQNFSNHSRMVPLFHYVGYPLGIFVLVVAGRNIYEACNEHLDLYIPILFFAIGLVLMILLWYARYFALRAQDRAIRAEENLRYFAITGNLLDSKLRMAQIIALRFAPNNELLDLAHRAVSENLSPKDIKKAIQHWKPDYNRV
ncbi:MAG: hypothetical protein JWQ27_3278 [Ferruginibacter sp.]|nr:hypothetical protein [Ferruginibacter sp.]